MYFVTKKKELLYYGLFLFFAAIYFFINAPFTFFGIAEEIVWNSDWYDKLNDVVIIIQNVFYLLFLKAFFTGIATDHKVKSLFRFSLLFIPAMVILFSLVTFSKPGSQTIYYATQLIPIIPALVVAVSVVKNKFLFAGLVANGLLINVAGTSLTVLMNILRNNNVHHLFTEGYPLIFVRIGILGDMIFFLAAILKKWHFQEKQLAVVRLQSQLEVEELRNRISAELHDDIGSTLSGISMYSHLAREQIKNTNTEEIEKSLNIMQQSAGEMVNKLNDIVWFVNPEQDSLQKLIQRLKEYVVDMAAIKNMKVKVNVQANMQEHNLSIESRRNIYLFSKEAINNAVKYSEATLLELNIKEANGILEFAVADNGKGFDITTIKKGNGLGNMAKRADEIGAILMVRSKQHEGSLLSIKLKIT